MFRTGDPGFGGNWVRIRRAERGRKRSRCRGPFRHPPRGGSAAATFPSRGRQEGVRGFARAWATESGLGARSDQGIAPYAKDRGLCGFARGGAGTEEKRAGKTDCHTSDIGHWLAMTERCSARCARTGGRWPSLRRGRGGRCGPGFKPSIPVCALGHTQDPLHRGGFLRTANSRPYGGDGCWWLK